MNTNKNSYIFIYASVMVIIVAFLLAFVSSSLKPIQQQKEDLDKKKQILASLNIFAADTTEAMYIECVKEELLLDTLGNVIDTTGAFGVKSSNIGKKEGQQLPIYVCEVEGEPKYVIPLYGAGLWGPIWGYVSLNADKETIYGVYFSHQGETPGLGAEITNREKFQNPFIDKYAVKDGKPVISVKKKVADETCEVNAISGGTITSDGVDKMLKACLGYYTPYLTQCDKACEQVVCDSTACAAEVPAEVIEVVNE